MKHHNHGSIGLILCLGTLTTAYAQNNVQLEEIVVTAEKRTTDLQKTPISITTLTGDELRKSGEVQLNEALRNVPGLQIQSSAQGGTMYIRGIGSNGDSNEVDLAVSVTIDGAYSGRSETLSSGLYDVGQIEVLRGPQGTIYGRNSTAGAVTINSANPDLTGGFGGNVNAQIGNYSLYHLDAALNAPINDVFGLRFAGMREKRDGYFSNNGRAVDAVGGRAKVLYEPSADTRMLLTVDYSRRKGNDLTTVGVTGTPTKVTFENNDPWYVKTSNPDTEVTYPANIIDHKFTTITGQLDFNLGWAKLTAIPTYSNNYRSTYSSLISGVEAGVSLLDGNRGENKEKQYTGEVRLASIDTATIQWVAGLYYLNTNNASVNALEGSTGTTSDMSTGLDLYTNNQEGAKPTTSSAAFGAITYPLMDTLRLLAGARYTRDVKSRAYEITSVLEGDDSASYDGTDPDTYDPLGNPSGYFTTGRIQNDADFSKTTYRVGLEYDVAADSMLYTTVSTGYKAGGFNRGFPTIAYEPEDLVSYELGSKNRFLDNTLQINGAAYYYVYNNFQVVHTESVPRAIPITYVPIGVEYYQDTGGQVANADGATVLGFEVQADWLATDNDRIRFNATLSRSKLGDFDPDLYEADLVAASGEQMSNAPNFTASPSYEHSWTVGNGRLSARLQTKYSTSYWTDTRARNRAGAWQDAYWRSDAYLTYDADANWTVSLWAKNLENEAQITQAFPRNRVFVTDPRTFGVNLSASF